MAGIYSIMAKRRKNAYSYLSLTPLYRRSRMHRWNPTVVEWGPPGYLQFLPPHSSLESCPGPSYVDRTFGWSAQTVAPIAPLPVPLLDAPALKRQRRRSKDKELLTVPTEETLHCLHSVDQSCCSSHSDKPLCGDCRTGVSEAPPHPLWFNAGELRDVDQKFDRFTFFPASVQRLLPNCWHMSELTKSRIKHLNAQPTLYWKSWNLFGGFVGYFVFDLPRHIPHQYSIEPRSPRETHMT